MNTTETMQTMSNNMKENHLSNGNSNNSSSMTSSSTNTTSLHASQTSKSNSRHCASFSTLSKSGQEEVDLILHRLWKDFTSKHPSSSDIYTKYYQQAIHYSKLASYDEAISMLDQVLDAIVNITSSRSTYDNKLLASSSSSSEEKELIVLPLPSLLLQVGVLSKIAQEYTYAGLFHEALERNRRALNILSSAFEQDQYYIEEEFILKRQIYHDIGTELFRQEHYTEALDMFQKSLEAYEHLQKHVTASTNNATATKTIQSIPTRIADLHRCIGTTYLSLELYDEALESFQKALNLLSREDGLTATIYYEMGETFKNLGEYNQSLTKFKQAYEISRNVLGETHPETVAAAHEIELFRNI